MWREAFFSPLIIFNSTQFKYKLTSSKQIYMEFSNNLLYKCSCCVPVLFHGAKISDFGLFGCLSMVFDGTKVMWSPDYRLAMCSTFSVSLCIFFFFFSLRYRSVVLKAGLFKARPGRFLSFFLSRKASAAPRASSYTGAPFPSSSSSSWMIC